MNSPRTPVIGLILAALVLLPGCRLLNRTSCNKPQAYQKAEDNPALKIPLGLDAPDTRTALHIPPLTEPVAPRGPDDPCLDAPPSYVTAPARPAAPPVPAPG